MVERTISSTSGWFAWALAAFIYFVNNVFPWLECGCAALPFVRASIAFDRVVWTVPVATACHFDRVDFYLHGTPRRHFALHDRLSTSLVCRPPLRALG